MWFQVTGVDATSGADRSVRIEADSESDAHSAARAAGVLSTLITPTAPPPLPPADPPPTRAEPPGPDSGAFALIFWGLVLVLLDFNFSGLPLLPDGVGYLLVSAGAGRLAVRSSPFRTASAASLLMAVVWALGLVGRGDLGAALALAGSLGSLVLFWNLLGGMIDLAAGAGEHDFATSCVWLRFLYCGVTVAGALLPVGGAAANALALPLLILVLPLIGWLLFTSHRAGRLLA